MSKWKCDGCSKSCVQELDCCPGFCMMDGKDAVWLEVKEQESNQLPKLTEEVFNRPDCPAWAQWAAVDEYGMVWLTAKKPNVVMIAGKANGWSTGGGSYTHWSPMMFDPSDWKNSLIKRPEKITLPEWCKPGAWVWSDGKYHKIIETGQDWIRTAWDDHTGIWGMNILCQFSQARLRPYNAEEMRWLVGKVIERNSSAYLVISYAHDELATTIYIEGKYLSEDRLMADFTIDGKPCGKLEHLENGEWVE